MSDDLVRWLKEQSDSLSCADEIGDTLNGRLLRLARWRLHEAAYCIETLKDENRKLRLELLAVLGQKIDEKGDL